MPRRRSLIQVGRAVPQQEVGLPGLGERQFRRQGEDGIQLRVEAFDLLQAGKGECLCAEFTVAHAYQG